MKILTGLAVAAFMMAGTASASSISYVVGFCGSFSNPNPNGVLAGSFICPSAATLGVGLGQTLVGGFINYNSDYSNGLNDSVTTQTVWTFTGGAPSFAADTSTSIGGSNSTPATSADLLVLNALTNAPNGWVAGGNVLAGFYNILSDFTGSVTVGYSNSATVGHALQATGYAQVVYAYTTDEQVTPEPSSLLLFGSGLLGLAAFGRKKLVRS